MLRDTKKLIALFALLLITSFFYTSSYPEVSSIQPRTMLGAIGAVDNFSDATPTIPKIDCSCVAPGDLAKPECRERGGEVKFSTATNILTGKGGDSKIVCGDNRVKIGKTEIKFVEDLNCKEQKTEKGEPKVQKCSVTASNGDMERLSRIEVASTDSTVTESFPTDGSGIGTSLSSSDNEVQDVTTSVETPIQTVVTSPDIDTQQAVLVVNPTNPTNSVGVTNTTSPTPSTISSSLNPIPAPERPDGSVIPDNRNVAWNNQRNSNQQPWWQQQNQNNNQQLNPEPKNSNPLRRMFNSFTNPSYAPRPELAREAHKQQTSVVKSSTDDKVAFGDIYKMLTNYDTLKNNLETKDSNSEPSNISANTTLSTNEFGEVQAYGVSKDELRKILSDIAGKEITEQRDNLPTVTINEDSKFVTRSASSTVTTPNWLRSFVLSGGNASADSSGYYGYVTSSDNKTVDIYEREKGKFVTLQVDKDGKAKVGLQNKDGNIVFIPTGGLLDADAQWGEFTSAFVEIAGREPEQTVQASKIPLAPFDIAVRELYGEDALEFGVPFAPDAPGYTLGKNGELIPVAVIDAAMDAVKKRTGVTKLQKQIVEQSDGKIRITTRASSFPLDIGVGLTNVRIMPVPQQMLLLARIKGEMESRGHENVGAAMRLAIFNTYDNIARKVSGVTAFTTRIDEDGNILGNTKVTFSLATLINEVFATFVVASNNDISSGTLTKFFGTLFSSQTPDGYEGNVYRVKDTNEESQTFGAVAVELVGKAIVAPFKLVQNALGRLFSR